MEQKRVVKTFDYEGIKGIIDLILFKEFTSQGVYMNQVMGSFGNGNDLQSTFDELVPQPVMDASMKAAEESIKNGIDNWHKDQQKIIMDKLLSDGFKLQNDEIMDDIIDILEKQEQKEEQKEDEIDENW